MAKKVDQEELDQARATLLEWLPRGMTVYTLLTSVNRADNSRWIRLMIARDGEIIGTGLSYRAALLLGSKHDPDKGIKCDGGGMDMGYHLVYSLSAALYGYTHEGGYTLKHRWL